ncbi:MAG: hypothetical protein ABI222_03375, partial [Opitutaceae bacterium]
MAVTDFIRDPGFSIQLPQPPDEDESAHCPLGTPTIGRQARSIGAIVQRQNRWIVPAEDFVTSALLKLPS